MNNITKRLARTVLTITLFFCFIAEISAEGLRVRGELITLKGNMATIKTSAGQNIDVALTHPYQILLYKDIALEDIPKGAYLSIPSVPTGNNKRRALGVNVFPEAMRGFNKGIGDWDLTADSKMTNATLAKLVSSNSQREIIIRFGDDSQTIQVPPNTQITTFGPVDNRKLKIGQKIVVFAKVAGGNLSGKFVGIHENGKLPPI